MRMTPTVALMGDATVSDARPMILVEGLRKSFGAVKALAGIDFTVPAGTVMGILGPNGAGKTTLVRILSTLMSPDGGRAEVAGFDVVRESRALRSAIGLAGQNVAIDEHLTGFENLYLVGRLRQIGYRDARREAGELLERFNLVDASGRTARTYSGGMRRRLDLAASLVGHPPVLFLDEPTTGLDPRARLELWEVIEGLVADGTTLLLTTQYLEEADRLASSIIVVDQGRIIAQGSPRELKATVGGEQIELSLASASDLDGAASILAQVSGAAPQVNVESRKIQVAAPRGSAMLVDALRKLDEVGIEPDDVSLRRPALDDVFLALTGHVAEDAGEPGDAELGGDEPGDAEPGDADGAGIGKLVDAGSAGTEPGVHPGQAERVAVGSRAGLCHRARWITGTATDTRVVMWRNLLRYLRLPNLLVFTTVQPVMFVLLFDFVFGGVIKLVVHGPYIDYLMPGIFLQAVVFGSTQTGIGLAEDFSRGMVDRFRSLPMARVAVLTGRTMADTVRNIFVVALMTGVGAIVGFRIENGVLSALVVVVMAVVFGMAFSWISAVIGLITRDVEAAQAAGFVWILPLTFASSAFVPVKTMPGWLQAFSKADPVTVVVDAMRGLLLGGPVAVHMYESIAWVAGIVVVCVPVALRLYRRLT